MMVTSSLRISIGEINYPRQSFG